MRAVRRTQFYLRCWSDRNLCGREAIIDHGKRSKIKKNFLFFTIRSRSKRKRTVDEEEKKNRKREKKEKRKDKKHSKEKSDKGKKLKGNHKSKHSKGDGHLEFQELSSDYYFAKNNEFATWLKEEKNVFFSDLLSESAREMIAEFVKACNRGKLESHYYEGIATGPHTSHTWKIKK